MLIHRERLLTSADTKYKHSIQNLSLHFRNKCGRRKKLLKDEVDKKLSPIYNGAATIVFTFTTLN
jgi:hypothetical protein